MRGFSWLVKLLLYCHNDTKINEGTQAEVYWNVGFAHQLHANLCVDACVAMLNHFYGLPFHSLENNPRQTFEGLDIKEDAGFTKVTTARSYKQIEDALKASPLVLNLTLRQIAPGVHLGHAVTLIGVRKEGNREFLIYHDPLTGPNREISYDELIKLPSVLNKGINLYIPPSKLPPSAKFHDKVHKSPNIIPTNYGKFFSDELGKKPIACFKKLLEDYASFALFSNRTHKFEVKDFLKNIENLNDSEESATQEKNLDNLIIEFNKAFPSLNQGELSSRFTVAKQYMNRQ
jgi:hypothetical protein